MADNHLKFLKHTKCFKETVNAVAISRFDEVSNLAKLQGPLQCLCRRSKRFVIRQKLFTILVHHSICIAAFLFTPYPTF